MNVTLQYFESCPNSRTTHERLKAVIDRHNLDVDLTFQLIESAEDAEKYGFHGSPSILVDGTDPFATEDTRVGYACRIYTSDDGPTEGPTIEQITEALGV